jgi:hypothetical protein
MIQVTCDSVERKQSEREVDQDLVEFDRFLLDRKLGDPMTRYERSIVKTYLWWKMWGAKEKVVPEGNDLERGEDDDIVCSGEAGFRF